MVTQKKLSLVAEIVETLQNKHNFALIKFEKTSHQSLESLRRRLKKTSSTFKVLKNTLFQKAINKLSPSNKNLTQLKKNYLPLKDNSALLVLQTEWSEGLGTFYKFMQSEKTLTFKCAVLDGAIYPSTEVLKIAKLPGKKELAGKILSSLNSPTHRFVHVLEFTQQKLVLVLSQKSNLSN